MHHSSAKHRHIFLKRGGELIYVDRLGRHSSPLIKYFEGIDGVPKIKDGYNPATWMLEITTAAQEALLGIDLAELYKNSELHKRNKALIKELSVPAPGAKDLYFPTKYSQSFFTQCMACLWKQHLSYWRNPPYTAVRLLFTIFVAVMFGTISWDLSSKRGRQQDFFNAVGSMYAAVMFLAVQNSSVSSANYLHREDSFLKGKSSWDVFSSTLCFWTEYSSLVEMVLLLLSCSLDIIWTNGLTVWRPKGQA